MYQYRCKCLRVIDGDTVELDIDLGYRIHTQQIVRLIGINAPEMRGESLPEAERAKHRLAELIDSAGELFCHTHLDRDDKYGRLLVKLLPLPNAIMSLNEILVCEGLCRSYLP